MGYTIQMKLQKKRKLFSFHTVRFTQVLLCLLLYPGKAFAFDIDIRVNGIKNSEAILAHYYGNQHFIVDSAFLDHTGKGRFAGDKTLEKGIYLVILPENRHFELLISDEQEFSVQTDTTDLFFKMQIEGAQESNMFLMHQKNIIKKQKLMGILQEGLRRMAPGDKRFDDIEKKMAEVKKDIHDQNTVFLQNNPGLFASTVVRATMPVEMPVFDVPHQGANKDSLLWIRSLMYFKKHYLDNINLSEPFLVNTPVLFNKLYGYFNQVLFQEPDSIIKAVDLLLLGMDASPPVAQYIQEFVLTQYNRPDRVGYEDVVLYTVEQHVKDLGSLVLDYKTRNDIMFKIKYMHLTAIGARAPGLTGINPNGLEVSLHEVRSPYTILMFWNPECPHCEEELDKTLAFYNEKKNLGFEIFAVCTHKDHQAWTQTIDEKEMTWINVYDPENQSKYRENYQVFYTPKLYLLNKDKTIIAKSNRLSDLIDAIE
jgi:peroxiredoxin